MDVRAWGVTWATGTGRKYLRAPRGSGFLYAMEEYELHPTARRYESYEMSVAAKIGLGVAAEYALEVGPEGAAQPGARGAPARAAAGSAGRGGPRPRAATLR